MNDVNCQREISEAVQAAERALKSLRQAREALQSAGHWGIADLLGGGLVTTFVKHSRMQDAESLIQQARSDLKCLQKELMDVKAVEAVAGQHIETGDFLSFADYFFDGLIADWLMQSRINEAKEQIDRAILKVEELQRKLRAQ